MKKTTIRIFALILAVISLACTFCGCGKNKMNLKVGVKLGQDYIDYMYDKNADDEDFFIAEEDRVFLNDVSIVIPYGDDEQVSALDAFISACVEYDLDYVLDEAGQSVKIVHNYQGFMGKDAEGNNLTFFWECSINGQALTSGRAKTNYVKDGDSIVFTLTSANENDFNLDDIK